MIRRSEPDPKPWERDAGFSKVPDAMLSDVRLTPVDKVVGATLLHWAWQQRDCWPSNEAIAQRACVSIPAVRRSLLSLERHGWIQRVPDPSKVAKRRIELLWKPAATGSDKSLGVITGDHVGDHRRSPNKTQSTRQAYVVEETSSPNLRHPLEDVGNNMGKTGDLSNVDSTCETCSSLRPVDAVLPASSIYAVIELSSFAPPDVLAWEEPWLDLLSRRAGELVDDGAVPDEAERQAYLDVLALREALDPKDPLP